MKDKSKLGNCLNVTWLQKVYREHGVAHVATDGAYVQIVTEGIKRPSDERSAKNV